MNTIEKVKEIIAEQLGLEVAEVTAEARVTDDLGADSLDMVELVMELEEVFGLKIAEEEMEHISTVQDVVNYIEGEAHATSLYYWDWLGYSSWSRQGRRLV
ncbi:MAG: acyl carrier protein [Firmicutes bacterium]|nr:acyl carrier protein [Bacillota bacterium]